MTSHLLIDTSSLMFRAFFALPTSITDAEGHAVNAVRGYLDMVSTVAAELRPDRISHCWDDAEVPEGRLAHYPQYKAERAEPPDEIIWQFGLLRGLLPLLGEQIVEAPGWEADDAIGTLAAAAGESDRVVILTGDRDLIQLVRDPVVQVWFTVSGVTKMTRYDESGVVEAFGIPADRYVDFAILRGDPSDGLPGVKGVGAKTAQKLIAAYPNLGALVDDAEAQTPALARTLAETAEYIAAMQHVVPVQTDVPLRTVGPDADASAVAEVAVRHAIESPVERWGERV
ncbi:5'-3' exonuclease [Euzebya tangerina]|uniref:5'-3' exonuclease n=1 Tax=Euzebya tangerina TaxID=591198 RepID=UPI000E3128B2|nr:5'-3' exonuclease [Euzebya tangerina]